MRKIIDFTSPYDGSRQKAVIIAPPDAGLTPLPLVIVPHAAYFSAEKTALYWRDIPAKRNMIAVFPFGHGRTTELTSLGWRGQIADLHAMPELLAEAGYSVDRSQIFAVGISMGGMECLLLAGIHPRFLAGAVVFNALVDLPEWYSSPEAPRANIVAEVGGTPDELPDEYAARSPIEYAATIARTPVLIYWDPNDEVVPGQSEKQSGLLLRRIKEADPKAVVVAETHSRGHFFVRPTLALDWLMSRTQGTGDALSDLGET